MENAAMIEIPEWGRPLDPEYEATCDKQLLEYPTVTRNDAGELDYFYVTPVPHEMSEDECEVDWAYGERLARETLALAGEYLDTSYALEFIVCDAYKALFRATEDEAVDTRRSTITSSFIQEILDMAVRGYAARS
jgi:hypothetical protein